MKSKKKRQCGCGNTLQQINTGNENLEVIKQLQSPKPPLQKLGQIVNGLQQGSGRKKRNRRHMRGRGPAYVDKYGAPIRAY